MLDLENRNYMKEALEQHNKIDYSLYLDQPHQALGKGQLLCLPNHVLFVQLL